MEQITKKLYLTQEELRTLRGLVVVHNLIMAKEPAERINIREFIFNRIDMRLSRVKLLQRIVYNAMEKVTCPEKRRYLWGIACKILFD